MRLIRAQDSDGSWESKSDADLRDEFILTRKQRRAMPVIGDPEPDVMWRYVLQACDRGALRPDDTANHGDETHGSFGRLLFTAGRFVALSRSAGSASRRSGASGGRYETGRRCDCSH
ncbi:DUF269 domain-containing protein [Mesorhizobium sp. M0016]|uniref:DUF269 domain-containing protein n=1 Tax=Mesorhizobium sp. M0016 TaxID=2956843 RepID=UPI00333BF3DF